MNISSWLIENLSSEVKTFFISKEKIAVSLDSANKLIRKKSGIVDFFESEAHWLCATQISVDGGGVVAERSQKEYGDYQTNEELATAVISFIDPTGQPDVVLEPTCGKGNFILAAVTSFPNLRRVIGVEVYLPYVWETKYKLLAYFISNPDRQPPKISILHKSFFDLDLSRIAEEIKALKVLVLGNPPWAMNADLSNMDSSNLPRKTNKQRMSGMDAITGKSNFDIAESILLTLLENFHEREGALAVLVKNSVIKNLLEKQQINRFSISNIQVLEIDAKKEFNVSVNCSLLYARMGEVAEYQAKKSDFYVGETETTFGWVGNKFVANVDMYIKNSSIDELSEVVWRQGVKHDCTKVMELEPSEGLFVNKNGDIVELESRFVHHLLKSSDLKGELIESGRKRIIMTQRKVGQDTSYIANEAPLTYAYLSQNEAAFARRKSSIYKGKPKFSIFGVGDYSFAPYKVAISGMYNRTRFSLVTPGPDGKPIMLDDTCYLVGFDALDIATEVWSLLNGKEVQDFLASIIFQDAKRKITKDVLMRICLVKAIETTRLENRNAEFPTLERYLEEQGESADQLALF